MPPLLDPPEYPDDLEKDEPELLLMLEDELLLTLEYELLLDPEEELLLILELLLDTAELLLSYELDAGRR